MTTGNAPDYKSKRYPDMSEVYKRLEQRAEQHRLERVVVDEAKAWCKDMIVDGPLKRAVDALEHFEANQKHG